MYLMTDDTHIFARIVEFASTDDAQRAVRELSESPLLGRPVFIREVSSE
jgi:RNA recognition motif-containing protein